MSQNEPRTINACVDAAVASERESDYRSALQYYFKMIELATEDAKCALNIERIPSGRVTKATKIYDIAIGRIKKIIEKIGNNELAFKKSLGVQSVPVGTIISQATPELGLSPSTTMINYPSTSASFLSSSILSPSSQSGTNSPEIVDDETHNIENMIAKLRYEIDFYEKRLEQLSDTKLDPLLSASEKQKIVDLNLKKYRTLAFEVESRKQQLNQLEGRLKTRLELAKMFIESSKLMVETATQVITSNSSSTNGATQISLPKIMNTTDNVSEAQCYKLILTIFTKKEYAEGYPQKMIEMAADEALKNYENTSKDSTGKKLQEIAEKIKIERETVASDLGTKLCADLLEDPNGTIGPRKAKIILTKVVSACLTTVFNRRLIDICQPYYINVYKDVDDKYYKKVQEIRTIIKQAIDEKNDKALSSCLADKLAIFPEVCRVIIRYKTEWFPTYEMLDYAKLKDPYLMVGEMLGVMKKAVDKIMAQADEIYDYAVAEAELKGEPKPKRSNYEIEGNAEQAVQLLTIIIVISQNIIHPIADYHFIEDFVPDRIFQDEEGMALATFSTAAERFITL